MLQSGVARPLALPPGRAPSLQSIETLFDLQIMLERRSAAGPYDAWDHALIEQWLADVRRAIQDALSAYRCRQMQVADRVLDVITEKMQSIGIGVMGWDAVGAHRESLEDLREEYLRYERIRDRQQAILYDLP